MRRAGTKIGLEADSMPIFVMIIRVKIRPYPSRYYYIFTHI
ncbi:hypothetical protein [uncultured Methanobrevibacter sp.]|nr:hypothetical protein [uncultured Methanobrevibacter sp.]